MNKHEITAGPFNTNLFIFDSHIADISNMSVNEHFSPVNSESIISFILFFAFCYAAL